MDQKVIEKLLIGSLSLNSVCIKFARDYMLLYHRVRETAFFYLVNILRASMSVKQTIYLASSYKASSLERLVKDPSSLKIIQSFSLAYYFSPSCVKIPSRRTESLKGKKIERACPFQAAGLHYHHMTG